MTKEIVMDYSPFLPNNSICISHFQQYPLEIGFA